MPKRKQRSELESGFQSSVITGGGQTLQYHCAFERRPTTPMMDGAPDNHENLQDHFFFLARNLLSIYSGPLFFFSSQEKSLHRMQRRLHSSTTLEVKPNGDGASFQAHMPAEGKDNLLTDNLKMTFPLSLSCIYSASDLAQFL